MVGAVDPQENHRGISGSCSREIAENFRTQILNNKGDVTPQPVRTLGSCTFMYLRHADLYILSITRANSNVMLAFKFMTSVRAHHAMRMALVLYVLVNSSPALGN